MSSPSLLPLILLSSAQPSHVRARSCRGYV
jgi:hypothetical protein